MNFDCCLGNPAFNIAEENNIAGTGGNTTLYKTVSRLSFDVLIKDNGLQVNITLKGIISDLVFGHFKDYQVNFINLMDASDVWLYNTCYFSVEKKQRLTTPVIRGGLAKKIFTANYDECFPFVYYSGSNSGMNKFFSADKPNKVIRKLPGKGRDSVEYDYTDKVVASGWKFAFTVLESKKSYIVTDEPIYGGTICYVPTDSKEEAEKLKLFVENNKVFEEYVKRMKVKGKAFAIRNIKRFDLLQINTGLEIPKEWDITKKDLTPSVKYDLQDKMEHTDHLTKHIRGREYMSGIERDNLRIKANGEVFTPTALVQEILDTIPVELFIHKNKTFIDPMCGDGQFLSEVLIRKLENGSTFEQALSTIYGVDLMPDNVKLCQDRLLCGREDLRHIVEQNIVCADALRYHYRFDGSHPYDDQIAQQAQEQILHTFFEEDIQEAYK